MAELCLNYSNESTVWLLSLSFIAGVVFPMLWGKIRGLIVFILQVAVAIPIGLSFSFCFLILPYIVFTFFFILIVELCLFLVLVFNIFNEDYRIEWWSSSKSAARRIRKHDYPINYSYWWFSIPTFSWVRSIICLTIKLLEGCFKSIDITLFTEDIE
jgi:hypothetical protein